MPDSGLFWLSGSARVAGARFQEDGFDRGHLRNDQPTRRTKLGFPFFLLVLVLLVG
jgi:hypothetical protein